MLTFHNDPAIKQKYLRRLAAHEAADEIIKGQYWEHGKGCAVGCTIHSSNHAAYETELGIPMWLAWLEDRLFENMPNAEAKTFPRRFLGAIPVGVDLTPVYSRFCAFLMRENIATVEQVGLPDAEKAPLLAVLRDTLAFHEDTLASGVWDDARAALLRGAAESAAWSAAESAAESAARSADWGAARGAARSAARGAAWGAAESGTWSAARSAAESAAWSAAWGAAESARQSAAYLRYANALIDMLKNSDS